MTASHRGLLYFNMCRTVAGIVGVLNRIDSACAKPLRAAGGACRSFRRVLCVLGPHRAWNRALKPNGLDARLCGLTRSFVSTPGARRKAQGAH